MADIFLSYAREEEARAKVLAEALEAEGWSVFWDRTIPPGKTWRKILDNELEQAGCIVVAWSRAANESHWVCEEEAAEGHERGILLPVLFEPVRPPRGFRALQAADLVDWDGDATAHEFRKLVQAIAAIKLPSSLAVVERNEPDQPSRSQTKPSRPSGRPKEVAAAKPPSKPPGHTPGTVFRDRLQDSSEGPEMVVIPAGTFRMGDLQGNGDSDQLPVHTVTIARPFALGRYAVTFDDYDRYAQATSRPLPEDRGWGRGRRPVIRVSWDDAVAYADWLSQQTGGRYRLPSEAEWEYAARAGTETAYWWGDDIRQDGTVWANCAGSGSELSKRQTAPVGSFPPNPWGLYDTAGNVWEWVQDCYRDNYKEAPTDGSEIEGKDCAQRVVRGGSWLLGPVGLRSAARFRLNPDTRYKYLGFRLAQNLP